MIPVMIFISCLYDSFNEFVHGGGGSKFWRPNLHPSLSSIYLIIQLRWNNAISLEQGDTGETVDVHEMASLVMFWVKNPLIKTLI